MRQSAMSNLQSLIDYISDRIELSELDTEYISTRTTERKYLKNQFIVQQGDICHQLSFIVAGCTRTYHTDVEEQEHVLRFALENWWAADMGSFLNQTPADCHVQCLENTIVLQISYPSLLELFELVPQFEQLFRVIFQQAFIAAEKRILHNISLNAKSRYQQFIDTYPNIEQRVPQYMIASYLGFSYQFLSKIRNELAKGN